MSESFSIDEINDALSTGNSAIFEKVFKKYYVMLCYEANEYVKDSYLAEEIVDDVFCKIWENRSTIAIKTSFREYLIQSVHYKSISYLRKGKNEKDLVDWIEENKTERYNLISLGETPLDYIISEELEEKIDSAIDLLPDQYRKAFVLSRRESLKYEEIAEKMDISVNTVKLYIKKALSSLREDLKDYLYFLFVNALYFVLFLNS
ncbi:MAG: RNA polymerase sigma-70 factor [Bacteroidetes bacterium]|nr:RNA polymerase sigma-70 factor [Bacteroidota bacterium]